ncbi:MAG: histidine kinase [Lautropia sp.]|nr:histidine kinase [Lautropia sp.]
MTENYKDKADGITPKEELDDLPPSGGTVTATLFVPVKPAATVVPPIGGPDVAPSVVPSAPHVLAEATDAVAAPDPAVSADGTVDSAFGTGVRVGTGIAAGEMDAAAPAGIAAAGGATDVGASAAMVGAALAAAGPATTAAGTVSVGSGGAVAVGQAAGVHAPVAGETGKTEGGAVKARRQSEGAPAPVVPDFCNAGVNMRTLVIVHLGMMAVLGTQPRLWVHATDGSGWGYLLLAFELPLLASMGCLCLLRKFLNGQKQRVQWALGVLVPVMITMGFSVMAQSVGDPAPSPTAELREPAMHWAVLARGLAAGLVACSIFVYFRLRARALAPSFSEARLQALQARIRPHFLFNSLNTVLGLIRTDPKRAESTLENLADLFRVFMRDARELVPLDDEVVTCKEYLAIEKLRLAPRLAVEWDIGDMPGDALLPSLLLQPLLENAVHHGIEPRTDTGVLNVRIKLVGERVRVEVDNPISTTVASRPGNQMALSNVRERLMLLYDTEAELRTGPQGDRYHVLLEFPYRKERRRRDVRRHFNPDR